MSHECDYDCPCLCDHCRDSRDRQGIEQPDPQQAGFAPPRPAVPAPAFAAAIRYPNLASLAGPPAGPATNPAIGQQCADALADIDSLENWKAGAIVVLDAWERVWDAAGHPGPLAASKADNVAAHITGLVEQLAELRQWAASTCELLHDLTPELPPHVGFREQVLALLRRMVNP